MEADTAAASYSVNSSHDASNFDDSLKELRNLRKQLYSAAEQFESSYSKDHHRQFVVESSKDYVRKALVSTVDHLGSLADKLNTFLDENVNHFSATNIQFSCIEQRLSTFQGFINLRGLSQNLLLTVEATGQHKHYIRPDAEKSKALYRECIIPFPPNDVQQRNEDTSSFCRAGVKSTSQRFSLYSRKEQPKMVSKEASPTPQSFSFTRVLPNKEPGRRSISPFRFSLKRSGTAVNRSTSPNLFDNKQQRYSAEPRRATSASRRSQTMTKEMEIESYTKRSKHLFKALLTGHRKEIVHKYRDY